MTIKNKSDIKIMALALLACFLWSTAFVAVKIGLRYFPPFLFAGIRFMIAGLVLLPFCGKPASFITTIRNNYRIIFKLAFFQIFILYGILFYALTFTPGALVAIVIGSSPLIAALSAHFLMKNDEMNKLKSVSLFIGIAGVIVLCVSRNPWSVRGPGEFFGIIILLIGVFSSSYGNILVSRNPEINSIHLNAAQIFIGGFLLFLVSLFIEGPRTPVPDVSFFMALAWLVFVSAAAFSIWLVLLSTPGVKVSELNFWKFSIPLSGAAISWILLPDESPELMPVLGMVFIAASIILSNVTEFIKKRKILRVGSAEAR